MNSFFAVSLVKPVEYVSSKILSIGLIGFLVAFILGLIGGSGDILKILLGTLLSSIMFALVGIIIASSIRSLNQFILATVPIAGISANKLEGMVLAKLSSLILFCAFVPYFVSESFAYIFVFLPSYWDLEALIKNILLKMFAT